MLLAAPSVGLANPGETYSVVFRGAVAYLEAAADTWRDSESGSLILSHALVADPEVLGSRSATVLASLDLASLDARARRVVALAPRGADVSRDVEAILSELSLPRADRIALDPDLRALPSSGIGEPGHRLPGVLDTALELQALFAAGIGVSTLSGEIQDALLILLELQNPVDGSWALVRDGEAGGSRVGDPAVTSEVILALAPYRAFVIDYRRDEALALGINLDIDAAIDDGISFLSTSWSTYKDADLALFVMALVAALPENDPAVGPVHQALIDAAGADGSYAGSAYATALAARALEAASDWSDYAFDADGDGDADDVDDDDDNDGTLDTEDAFPFDPTEQSDFDADGVGDGVDPDLDGDGVIGETTYATNPVETGDADLDGTGDVADPDDDNDGVPDVEELLAGLDPESFDTDGDSFRDGDELAMGTDAADASTFPPPDGDVYPLGAPDGVIDARDALLAIRVLSGQVAVPSGDELFFKRHGDLAPTVNGAPAPDDAVGAGDVLLILEKVQGGEE